MTRFGTAVAFALGAIRSVYGVGLYVSHFSGTLYSLDFSPNDATGKLSITSSRSGCGVTPAWLDLHREDQKLYCFDESWTGRGTVGVFDVGNDGGLAVATQMPSAGNDVHGRRYGGADGNGFIATAQYSPSTITTYKLPLSANTKPLQKEKFTMARPGPDPRQDVPHPHEVILDPTGRYLLVPDLGADFIRTFRINAADGRIVACGNAQTGAGDGPRHGTWWTPQSSTNSTDGLRLYTLNELGNSVSAWDVGYENPDCLSLIHTQTLSTYNKGVTPGPLTKAAEIRTFGNFLYASNRADETFGPGQDSIATYSIDPVDGELTWLEAANSHSYYPRTFQINKAGTLVAVGGQTSSNVAIVSRDTATGSLGALVATIVVGNKGQADQENGLSAVVWNE